MPPTYRHPIPRAAILAALCLAIAGLSRPALAGAPPTQGSTASDDVTRAKRLLRKGNEAFREGDLVAAERAYREAYALRAGYDTAGSLGDALLKLGKHAEAAGYLDECVRTLPATAPEALRERMSRALEEARAQAGSLRITVNLAGADVLIDGKRVGKSPLRAELFVEPGERIVEVRLGDKTASESILVARASSQQVALTIDTGPDMKIVIAGGAAGVLGIGLGLTFTILSNGKAGDAEDLKGTLEASGGEGACNVSANKARCDELSGLRDDQTTLGNLSFWSFVGSGAVLAGTAVYVLTNAFGAPAPEASTGVRAAPLVVAKGGGLMIGGSF